MNRYVYKTDFGYILIEDNGDKVTKVKTVEDKVEIEDDLKETDLIKMAYEQLMEYFNGVRKEFDFPFEAIGTEFQKKVWDALLKIPYGKTCTYKDIAEAINNPKGYRAVGLANNRNPLWIVIPCHRVIGSNNSLVGYGGGLELKERLLRLEKKNA